MKNKHITLEDRIEIQECLSKGMTFKAIASRIGKDPTTVSKEVKLHAKEYSNSFTKTDKPCPKLLKAPFVCNGCISRNHSNCPFARRKYVAKTAQTEYEMTLVESRQGIPLNKEEFYTNERIISEAVKGGQHIYHAIQANHLSVSKSTVYRHIQLGYYEITKSLFSIFFRTSFRQILPLTASKTLAIRQYSCGFFPCHRQNYARKSAHKKILNRL